MKASINTQFIQALADAEARGRATVKAEARKNTISIYASTAQNLMSSFHMTLEEALDFQHVPDDFQEDVRKHFSQV